MPDFLFSCSLQQVLLCAFTPFMVLVMGAPCYNNNRHQCREQNRHSSGEHQRSLMKADLHSPIMKITVLATFWCIASRKDSKWGMLPESMHGPQQLLLDETACVRPCQCQQMVSKHSYTSNELLLYLPMHWQGLQILGSTHLLHAAVHSLAINITSFNMWHVPLSPGAGQGAGANPKMNNAPRSQNLYRQWTHWTTDNLSVLSCAVSLCSSPSLGLLSLVGHWILH